MSEGTVIALFGVAGRMGREILRQNWRHDDLVIAYGYDLSHIGEIVEQRPVQASPEDLPSDVRLVMDFSAADAVLEHLELARRAGAAYLCGVTGLSEDTIHELRATANEIPVFHAANLSPGMAIMLMLAKAAAKALPNYERHIFETHHSEKKDAPSGTALHLAEAVNEATGQDTPITALRMGDVTGEHRIIFGGPGERLEITHRADSRAVFAVGALRAAEWLRSRSPGFYKMSDVLGL